MNRISQGIIILVPTNPSHKHHSISILNFDDQPHLVTCQVNADTIFLQYIDSGYTKCLHHILRFLPYHILAPGNFVPGIDRGHDLRMPDTKIPECTIRYDPQLLVYLNHEDMEKFPKRKHFFPHSWCFFWAMAG